MYMYAYIIFEVEYQMVDVKSNFRSISWWKEVRDNSVLQMHCGRSRLLTQQLNGIDREVQWMPRDRRIPRSTEQNATRMMMLMHVCQHGLQVAARQSWINWVYRFDKRSMRTMERAIIEQSNEEVHEHLYSRYMRAKAVSLEEQAFLHLARDFRKREDCWK